ncbi:hypothetical protein [Candidatus Flexifilum breve]|uniref:hypothetical protein n=1 Tax=Candidatus Flexifilum breve TaxID=3140694 RepID=UPI0031CCCA1D
MVGIAKLLRANLQTYALIFATVIIWLYFSYLTNGSFLSPQNFSNLFRQMVITGFLSVGMVLVTRHKATLTSRSASSPGSSRS